MIIGVLIGAVIGAFGMSLFAINAYEKGYNDGRSEWL